MANTGITQEDVFEAIETLARKKVEPTLANIRTQLGTGSLSTISKHLQRWRQVQKSSTPTPEVPQDLLNNFSFIWKKAYDIAIHELKTEKDAFLLDKDKFEKDRDLIIDEISKLETKVHALSAEETSLQNEGHKLRAENTRLEKEFLEIKTESKGLEQQVEMYKKHLEEEKNARKDLENKLFSMLEAKK